jgi:hypothetical protein
MLAHLVSSQDKQLFEITPPEQAGSDFARRRLLGAQFDNQPRDGTLCAHHRPERLGVPTRPVGIDRYLSIKITPEMPTGTSKLFSPRVRLESLTYTDGAPTAP